TDSMPYQIVRDSFRVCSKSLLTSTTLSRKTGKNSVRVRPGRERNALGDGHEGLNGAFQLAESPRFLRMAAQGRPSLPLSLRNNSVPHYNGWRVALLRSFADIRVTAIAKRRAASINRLTLWM